MMGLVTHLMDEADIGSGEKSPAQLEIQNQMQLVSNPALHRKDDALNDARAQQQMIEGNVDTSDAFQRIEEHHSQGLEKANRPIQQSDSHIDNKK